MQFASKELLYVMGYKHLQITLVLQYFNNCQSRVNSQIFAA